MNFNVNESVKRGKIGASMLEENSSTSRVSFFILSKLFFNLTSSVSIIRVLNESNFNLS